MIIIMHIFQMRKLRQGRTLSGRAVIQTWAVCLQSL